MLSQRNAPTRPEIARHAHALDVEPEEGLDSARESKT